MNKLKDTLMVLVSRVDDLEQSNTQLQKQCQQLEENCKSMEKSILEEVEDRNRRRKNLIISGIPEEMEGSAEERKETDRIKIESLFKELNAKA